MAIIIVGSGGSFEYVLISAPVYAPIDINPACPKDSSPKNPVTRLRDTANIILTVIGITRDLYCLDNISPLSKVKISIYIAITAINFIIFFKLTIFFILSYTFTCFCLPKSPVGLAKSTITSTPNTIASASSVDI